MSWPIIFGTILISFVIIPGAVFSYHLSKKNEKKQIAKS
jgi:hypothetical protein